MKVRFSFIAFIAFCCSCQGQETSDLENDINKLLTDYNAIGASVVVVKDNKICYHHSFGYNPDYNDPTTRNPIPDNGIFWLASVSKTFISTAIMQLVERKKLTLDDDVNKYLKLKVTNPKYPNVPITIRMLLCHRSSINDKHYGWNLMLNYAKGEKWRDCYNDDKPGEKYFYCNLNYSLLGAIIENVSDMRFDQYIDENICEPLGLEASFNLTKMDSTRLVRTLKYDKTKNKFKKSLYIFDYQYVRDKLKDYQLGISTSALSPAGGMRMTAMDLAKWMLVHMNYGLYENKRILSKESELEMWKPQGNDRSYGLAFSHYPKIVKGVNLCGMTGGSHGINSVMFFNPEKKYGFVVITNGYIPNPPRGHLSSLARELVRPLYNFFIKER